MVGDEAVALRFAAASHSGAVDGGVHNDDAAYAGAHLLLVADAFGGHGVDGSPWGMASNVAVEELRQLDVLTEASDLANRLDNGMDHLRETIRQIYAVYPYWNTGTSLTAMLWRDTHAAIAQIGDTRAYMLRGGELIQLTKDHTIGQYLIDEGRIRPAELGTDHHHSLVMRLIGERDYGPADITVHEGAPGDRYLLCTDGVHDIIPFEALRNILQDTTRDPQDAVDEIVSVALPVGHYDDFTCIVADIVDKSGASAKPVTLLPYDSSGPRVKPVPPRWRRWRRGRAG